MESLTDETRRRLKEDALREADIEEDASMIADVNASTTVHPSPTASLESSSVYASPEACLFVANLPIQWTNEELSYKLLTLFSRFGAILSVKTSRDSEGRPFGFIQFKKVIDASYAQRKRRTGLVIGGRKIRIEKARCLRKLQIGILKDDQTPSMKNVLTWMRDMLKDNAMPEDITLVDIDPEEGACENDRLYFIVKLKDHLNADAIYQDIKQRYPNWSIEWLSLVNGMSHPDGLDGNSVGGMEELERRSLSMMDTTNKKLMDDDWRKRNGSETDKLDGLAKSLGHLSVGLNEPLPTSVNKSTATTTTTTASSPTTLTSSGSPSGHVTLSGSGVVVPQGYEIFVGRLHPRKITEDMVMERFSKYGEIINIHMVNKNAVQTASGSDHHRSSRASLPAMPQDAFAFILYEEEEAAKGAILHENGHLWAGQPIKVSYAVLKPSSSSLRVTPGQASTITMTPTTSSTSMLATQGRFASSPLGVQQHSGTYRSSSSQRSVSLAPPQPPPPPPPHPVNYCYSYPAPLPYWHASPISNGRNVYFPLYYPYHYLPMGGNQSLSRPLVSGIDFPMAPLSASPKSSATSALTTSTSSSSSNANSSTSLSSSSSSTPLKLEGTMGSSLSTSASVNASGSITATTNSNNIATGGQGKGKGNGNTIAATASSVMDDSFTSLKAATEA